MYSLFYSKIFALRYKVKEYKRAVMENISLKDTETQEIRQVALKVFFDLLAEKGLSQIRIEEIAQALFLPIDQVSAVFPHKFSFFESLQENLEEKMASEYESFSELSLKDFLFESIMRRFELLMPYKQGLSAFLKSFQSFSIMDLKEKGEEGLVLLQSLPLFYKNMENMLLKWQGPQEERAAYEKLQTSIPFLIGLCIAYGMAGQVWAEDTDPSLSQTLAAVDRYIDLLLGQFN